MKRILTALALIPIVVYVVLWANYWVFLRCRGTVACLCYREYNDIAAAYGFGAPGAAGIRRRPAAAGLAGRPMAGPGRRRALLALTLAMRAGDLAQALPRVVAAGHRRRVRVRLLEMRTPAAGASPHWLMYALTAELGGR